MLGRRDTNRRVPSKVVINPLSHDARSSVPSRLRFAYHLTNTFPHLVVEIDRDVWIPIVSGTRAWDIEKIPSSDETSLVGSISFILLYQPKGKAIRVTTQSERCLKGHIIHSDPSSGLFHNPRPVAKVVLLPTDSKLCG
jgi:hypothetical protein